MRGDPQRRYSLEDYHRIEEASAVRHEFFDGEIFAMAGGTVAHNHIVANVVAFLRSGLAATHCSAFGSDMRLHTPSGLLTYPDAMVICGSVELVEGRQDEVKNPVLLVEVLSDATREYDRGEKFDLYKSIPTFAEYLIVEQREPLLEHHRREKSGKWVQASHASLDHTVQLTSVALSLPLKVVYSRVF